MYKNFNKVEDSILNVVNSSNDSGGIDGGRTRSGLQDMVYSTANYTDGTQITKKNKERVKKINKLSEEILSLSSDMKSDVNAFFEKKYPKDWKKFTNKY